MKALTLTEPWATLVACGAKRIETRDWATPYRGPLAIHAAKRMTGEDLSIARRGPSFPALLAAPDAAPYLGGAGAVRVARVRDAFASTRGCVVAVCRLAGGVRIPSGPEWDDDPALPAPGTPERAFGWYGPGRVLWFLEDVRPLPAPVPAKGALGLWEWDELGAA